jgi:hypothetical protein
VEWSETNLFAFNPAMSYASPEWIKSDPDYWAPKAAKSAMTHKQQDKPVAPSKSPQ